jgi:hypothetical protein
MASPVRTFVLGPDVARRLCLSGPHSNQIEEFLRARSSFRVSVRRLRGRGFDYLPARSVTSLDIAHSVTCRGLPLTLPRFQSS